MGWGAKKSNTSIPRLTAIQVQTSAKNVTIGRALGGTVRANCNLLDYVGFSSEAVKTQSGGKGGGGSQVTGYNYSADVILGIVSGPIYGIRTVWKDKGRFDSVAAAGLSYTTGAFGQAAWGYMSTNYPAQALGYSGIAYAYASGYSLGQGATLANHAFEVQSSVRAVVSAVTIDDADPADLIDELLTNTYHGVPQWPSGALASLTSYSDYCFANGLFLSVYLDAQVSAASVLRDILDATNSECVWSDGKLKIVPFGDQAVTGNGVTWTPDLTPIYDLTVDSFVDSDGEDALTVEIKRPAEAWNSVQIGYLDRAKDYAEDVMPAADQGNIDQFGLRKEDVKSLHAICDADVARVAAQLRLQRACYVRRRFRFRLDWRYSLLEPMDLVTVTYIGGGLNLNRQLVRILEFNEDDETEDFDVLAEEVLVGTASAPLYGNQAGAGMVPNYDVLPGPVQANLLRASEDWDDTSYWSLTNATISANAATGPFGNATADKLRETNAAGEHTVSQDILGPSTGVRFTTDVYAKAVERTACRVLIYDATSTAWAGPHVNLSTGATTDAGNAAFAYSAYSVTDMGSGWYRIRITVEALTSDNEVRVSTENPFGTASFTGTTNSGIYVTCAQSWPSDVDVTRDYVRTWDNQAVPMLFNPPSALTPGGIEVWAAVAGGADWGGADVYMSLDGTNYSFRGQIDARARYGFLSADLADHADPDNTNTLSVDFSQSRGTLADATSDDADLGATQLMVGTEVITYADAAQTDPYMIDLDALRRGFLNSVHAAHVAGDMIVRLDDAVFSFGYLGIQAGQTIYVKFCSFNVYGRATQDLADVIEHSIIPFPLGSREPSSTAWLATGTQFANYGTSIPAIVIEATGAGAREDNPDAEGVIFSYRVAGTTIWADDRMQGYDVLRTEITSVTTNTAYDVAVRYVVNGNPGTRLFIDTVTVGTLSTGIEDGSILLSDGVAGVGKTFTLPAGTYTHIDIQLVGPGGDGNYQITGGGGGKGGPPPTYDFWGGGGAGLSEKTGIAITAGTTVVTFSLYDHGSTSDAVASIVSPAVSLQANHGTNATTTAVGTGGSASGGTTNTAGSNGGGVNTWDGGKSGDPSCVDQTSNGSPGNAPGGGGAGASYDSGSGLWLPAPGSGSRIIIIARA